MNEQITLGAKEKTALSILLGLRQKFAREYRKYPREYSSLELYKVFSEMLNKINRKELDIFNVEKEVRRINTFHVDNVIDDAIDRSTIKRYPWPKVFGTSLTEVILRKRKEGLTAEEAYREISNKIKRGSMIFSKSNTQTKKVDVKSYAKEFE